MWATIVSAFFSFLYSKIAGFFGSLIRQKQKDEEADTSANDSVAPLQKAKTEKEIDDAADSALNNL